MVAALFVLGAAATPASSATSVTLAAGGGRLIYTHRVAGGPLLLAPRGPSRFRGLAINSHTATSRRSAPKGTAPSIRVQPSSVTAKAGTKVSLKAAASGSPRPAVHWQDSSNGKKWTVIRGATATTYGFIASAAKNGYSYKAIFANSAGAAATKVVKLKVLFAPKITDQPVAAVAQAGATTIFSAAASGEPRPSVHWQESATGATWSEIGGATSSTYSFAALASENGYQFEAVYKNAEGKATTHRVSLTVTPAPVAPAVTGEPAPATVTAGSSASFIASASGSPAPTIQWDISTDGATWSPIVGATAATYSFAASIGESNFRFEAIFTNVAGSATSNPATLTVNPLLVAPTVVTQPLPDTVANGSTASFMAAASGDPAPTVQWQQSTDGVSWTYIGGQTSTSLVFTAAYADTGDQYRAVFSNTQGFVISSAVTLTVTLPSGFPVVMTQPRNDAVNVGAMASFTASASGSPTPTVLWSVSTNGGQSWATISGATSTTYVVTTTANEEANEYEATFTNAVGAITTNPATLSVVVNPSATSSNWSGYADSGSTFTGISSTWTVPTATCSGSSTQYSSEWIGIDGDGSATVEQDGTDADCFGGQPTYYAWYEMFGDSAVNAGYEVELPYAVSPGDVISASVTVTNNSWTLALADSSTVSNGWANSYMFNFTAQQSSAEWIVERPEINSTLSDLAEFSPVTFTNAQVSGGAGTGGITTYSAADIEMTNNSDLLAIASGLNTAGTTFSDFWQAST